jgi:hypothetical protein
VVAGCVGDEVCGVRGPVWRTRREGVCGAIQAAVLVVGADVGVVPVPLPLAQVEELCLEREGVGIGKGLRVG